MRDGDGDESVNHCNIRGGGNTLKPRPLLPSLPCDTPPHPSTPYPAAALSPPCPNFGYPALNPLGNGTVVCDGTGDHGGGSWVEELRG